MSFILNNIYIIYMKIKLFNDNDIEHLKIELDIKNEDKLIEYLKTHI